MDQSNTKIEQVNDLTNIWILPEVPEIVTKDILKLPHILSLTYLESAEFHLFLQEKKTVLEFPYFNPAVDMQGKFKNVLDSLTKNGFSHELKNGSNSGTDILPYNLTISNDTILKYFVLWNMMPKWLCSI